MLRRLMPLTLLFALGPTSCGEDDAPAGADPNDVGATDSGPLERLDQGSPLDSGVFPADSGETERDVALTDVEAGSSPGPDTGPTEPDGGDGGSADLSPDGDGGPDDLGRAEDSGSHRDATVEDSGQPGCEPNPFVPPGQPAGWHHLSTELLTVTQGAPNHRGQDVVVAAGAPQLLVGKMAYGLFDKDLVDEDVEVFVQDEAPCGPWLSLGVVRSSDDGQYGTQYGIEDDGGRVFFAIPRQQARPVGRTPVRLLVRGDHSQAALSLYVVQPGTSTVVFDIDGTLTTDDFELVSELFSDLFRGDYVPEMWPGALDVVWAWADRGYLVHYVTGRPDLLRHQSLTWLVDLGFPPGPLHLTDTNAQALPTADGVARYKSEYLLEIAGEEGAASELNAAYGNATTDILAYSTAGIPPERTYIIGPHAGENGTVAVRSYPEHLPEAEAMLGAPVPAPAGAEWEIQSPE